MCPSRFLPAAALLVAAVGLTTASAADLKSIERTLKDEPKYNTAKPRYCLLVFGQQASTRVWLVHDGDVTHVHASPDGKAAANWRQVKANYSTFVLGDVWEDGGKVRYTDLRYNAWPDWPSLSIKLDGHRQSAGMDRAGKLQFALSPKEAPIIHFNGPVTLDLFYEQEALISNRTVDLTAVVGTHGVGAGTFAAFHCSAYPRNAWPTAVVEYPPKEKGGPPIVVKIRLEEN